MKACYRISLLIAALLLGACSNKLAYQFADWWLESQVLEYLDLNREQRKNMSKTIDELHAWHQREEIPKYLALLQSIEQQLQQGDPLQAADIEELEQQAYPLWINLLDKSGPWIVHMIYQLDDKQLDFLWAKVETNNEELQERFTELSDQERREKTLASLSKSLKPYFGKLNPEQKLRAKEWAQELQLSSESELEDRLAWQEKFSGLIHSGDSPENQETMLALFDHKPEEWVESKRSNDKHNRPLRQQLFADMVNLATAKQRKKLLKEIKKYRRLCEELAQQTI